MASGSSSWSKWRIQPERGGAAGSGFSRPAPSETCRHARGAIDTLTIDPGVGHGVAFTAIEGVPVREEATKEKA